jgi:hypothetical protein
MSMSGHLKNTLAVFTGTVLVTSFTALSANAATVQKTFTLNSTAPYTGTGFFDYDDALLFTTGDPSGNLYADILNATFGYTGQASQVITDPFKRVNFDSIGNFLGIDLEIADPFNLPDTILIANENAYIPSASTIAISGVVGYEDRTAIPTPALLPGLAAIGWASLKRKQKATQTANSVTPIT